MLIKSKKVRIECLRKLDEIPSEGTSGFNWRVVLAVRGALSRLSPIEREIVERYHFCGQSDAEISMLQKTPELRVHRILNEAHRKLKRTLGSFVQNRYGVPVETESCPICRTENRASIEKLLSTKTKEETWKRILRKLQDQYQIRINPRALNRHLKEHLPRLRKNPGGSTT